jgi:prepilin peptidase dependent protein B
MNHIQTLQSSRQKGWSLIDTMVGLALGLIVCSAGGGLMAQHWHESRALVSEARLMQDLGAAQDLIVRSVRRSGFGSGDAGAGNPYIALTADPDKAGELRFSLSLDAKDNHRIDSNEDLGFRLRDGVLQMLVGDAGWQAVTDSRTLRITALRLQPQVHALNLSAQCPSACRAAGGAACVAPQQLIRSFKLTLQAQAIHDRNVVRSLQSTIHLRNDAVIGACPV